MDVDERRKQMMDEMVAEQQGRKNRRSSTEVGEVTEVSPKVIKSWLSQAEELGRRGMNEAQARNEDKDKKRAGDATGYTVKLHGRPPDQPGDESK